MCDICGKPSHQNVFSRRNFVRLAAAGSIGFALRPRPSIAADEKPKPENVISPEQALARLRAGNERYAGGKMKSHDLGTERKALAGGQNPYAGILSCADSRVSPEYAFDTGLGDIFVVRVAGNFLDEDGLASFEYAVKFVSVPLIVVLGHEKCGAVDAAIKTVKDSAELPGHLPGLVEPIKPAVRAAMSKPGDLLENAIRENVLLNVRNLKAATPVLKEYVDAGKVHVAGGIYRLQSGKVDWIA